jgi:hypothetical protein
MMRLNLDCLTSISDILNRFHHKEEETQSAEDAKQDRGHAHLPDLELGKVALQVLIVLD